jgi:signal transduction histidine kinase/ActR/RegA family two-component response regulator
MAAAPTIRRRLLALALALLLPAIVAALWVIWQTWTDERRALERHMRDQTRALSMLVDQELTQRAVIARVLALSRNLDTAPQLTAEQLALFEQQARRAMQGLHGWIELSTADGELLSTRLPAASAAGAASTRTGMAAAPLPKRAAIGVLETGPSGGGLRAAVTQPVERDGRLLLNLSVMIVPQELQSIIDRQQLPDYWVASVMDSRGVIVARHPGGAAFAGRPADERLQALLRSRGEALFESTTLDGRRVLAYYSTSPQGWTYLTAIPRSALAGRAPQAVLPVVLGALALLALGIAGALLAARRIAGPVCSLKGAATALQQGRPVARAPTGLAECDDVAAALADADAALRQGRDELQRQVDEAVLRTRESEQRAAQSQRIAALGQLTGGVAHDFNNLLGVISNNAHLVARRPDAEAQAQAVAAILRAVEAGSQLSRHLLRFAGRQMMRPQRIDLAAYLHGAVELLRTVLGRRIKIELTVAPDTRPIDVDAAELELALINMALNSRDAITGAGQVWLRARNAVSDDLPAELAPGDYVLLSFGDDGCGMDEELATRAFDPFLSGKPGGQGVGLGLSQVHGFCAQSGGAARLASTPGLGTTVSLLLPASAVSGAAGVAAGTNSVAARTQAGEAPLAGRRVLLVEDNVELGEATASLLASFGALLLRAGSAAEALQIFGQGQGIDVVLSDVMMSGATDEGLRLARELRQRRPDVPIVLISGYSKALDPAPEFTVLHKPCPPEQLLTALQQAMEPVAEPSASGPAER